MTPEERIVVLERELEDTRRAAVRMGLNLVKLAARSLEEHQDLALGLAAMASGDPIMERLAWPVAEALHRGQGMEQA